VPTDNFCLIRSGFKQLQGLKPKETSTFDVAAKAATYKPSGESVFHGVQAITRNVGVNGLCKRQESVC
jgi:hypothetical protein